LNLDLKKITFASGNSTIQADSTNMTFTVPIADGFKFVIGTNDTLEILANGDLQINGKDIFGIVNLSFETSGIDINSSTSGLEYNVPTGDTHTFEINNTDVLQITSTQLIIGLAVNTIDFNGADLTDVDDISFTTSGVDINSSTSGLEYDVAGGDSHLFQIGNTSVLTLSSSQITIGANVNTIALNDADITGVDDILFDDGHEINATSVGLEIITAATNDRIEFEIGDNNEVMTIFSTDVNFFQDIDLQTGATVDFPGSSSSVGSTGFASSLPTNPTGYITIKVLGVERKIPFYNV